MNVEIVGDCSTTVVRRALATSLQKNSAKAKSNISSPVSCAVLMQVPPRAGFSLPHQPFMSRHCTLRQLVAALVRASIHSRVCV